MTAPTSRPTREQVARSIADRIDWTPTVLAGGERVAIVEQILRLAKFETGAEVHAVSDGDDVEGLRDQLARARSLIRTQHRELVQLTMVPPLPYGEGVPVQLDAAADAVEALGWTGTANTFRDLASQLQGRDEDTAEVRAVVAAALAGGTS